VTAADQRAGQLVANQVDDRLQIVRLGARVVGLAVHPDLRLVDDDAVVVADPLERPGRDVNQVEPLLARLHPHVFVTEAQKASIDRISDVRLRGHRLRCIDGGQKYHDDTCGKHSACNHAPFSMESVGRSLTLA
jgi:hypothetical protein